MQIPGNAQEPVKMQESDKMKKSDKMQEQKKKSTTSIFLKPLMNMDIQKNI